MNSNSSDPRKSSPLTLGRVLYCLMLGSIVLTLSAYLVRWSNWIGGPVALLLCYACYLALEAAWYDRHQNQPWPWYKIPVGWMVALGQMPEHLGIGNALGCLGIGGFVLMSLFLLFAAFCYFSPPNFR